MADAWEPTLHRPLCATQRICDALMFFGEIDESNADDLSARAVAEIEAGVVCIDLSQVRFFGAAGVRMIFAARAAAAGRAAMRVVCSPEVMRTLEVCRLTALDGLRLTAAPETRDGGGEGAT